MAAILSPSDFRIFFTDADTNYFWRAFHEAPLWNQRIASAIPMGTEQMLFGWIGRLDKMREWLGSRVERAPAPQTYLIVVQNWELTEVLDRFKFADDTYGIYYPLIEGMGIATKKNPDYQLRDLIYNQGSQTGGRQNGPDGLTGWNSAHPIDFYDASKGTYCNDFRNNAGVTVNGLAVGGPLAPVAYQTLWGEMSQRKSETGEAMGVIPGLLASGPQLAFTSKTLLQAQFLAPQTISTGMGTGVGAYDNVAMRGSADYLMMPEFFTSSRQLDWMLLDVARPLKPFMVLERSAPLLIPRIDPTDPASFDRHALIYGVESRLTVGWGPAFLSSISGPT